ncbi:MAG TPA: hypothetical protein P5114_03840 [Hyphomicrobiaceae bacterium]|nr:hypothetical protein [Hyphomicrobiaceae bacterium]
MHPRIALFALASVAVTTPVSAQEAATVAGRPALSTKSTQDLFSQREKWGTAPASKPAKLAKGEPPPPVKADKAAAAPASYAVLPVGDLGKLIAMRETWGKGPAGYEKKKVVAPLAAGTRAAKTKAKKARKIKAAKKKKQKN